VHSEPESRSYMTTGEAYKSLRTLAEAGWRVYKLSGSSTSASSLFLIALNGLLDVRCSVKASTLTCNPSVRLGGGSALTPASNL
jgi:hypothetical protein